MIFICEDEKCKDEEEYYMPKELLKKNVKNGGNYHEEEYYMPKEWCHKSFRPEDGDNIVYGVPDRARKSYEKRKIKNKEVK